MSEGLWVCWLPAVLCLLQWLVPVNGAGVGGYQVQPNPRVIYTKYGHLQGLLVKLSTRNLSHVEIYLGVPYASPPVGSLRFMPPVTPPPWSGVRNADHFGQVCPQRFPDISNETESLRRMPRARYDFLKRFQPYLRNFSEDCLYLNIYVPAKASHENRSLPVMVYIHGESYEWNSGNLYDGTVLASFGDVIVVTVNYRLGILGFLNIESDPTRGNYGLLDQVAALHWIEENVQEFGGDPHNVTIFGHDHGAACVNFLMISPVAKGLFHRAILMSGSALADWALVREPLKYALQLATALECSTTDSDEIARCLRVATIEALLEVELNVPDHTTAFGPTVDGIVIRNEPESIMQNMHETKDHYDLMFGVTSTEGVFPFGNEEFMSGFGPDKKSRVVRTFVRNIYQYHMNEIYSVLNNEYTDWTKPVQHPVNIRDATMEMFGDAQFVAPLVKAGDLYSSAYMNTYFYVFEHQSPHEDYPQRLGCFHGEELPYVFGAPLVEELFHFRGNYTKAEQKISEIVMRYWTNFAKTGDPNIVERQGANSNTNRFVKTSWALYETVHQKYLSIGIPQIYNNVFTNGTFESLSIDLNNTNTIILVTDGRPKVRHHYRAHKMSVWLKLVPDIHRSGGSAVSMQHHLLDNHDDPSTYEGALRSLTSTESSHPTSPTTMSPTIPHPSSSNNNHSGTLVGDKTFGATHPTNNGQIPTPPGAQTQTPASSATTDSAAERKNGTNPLRVEAIQQAGGNYSTALSVTIAVGCSLLILNVLIFAGVYYQRDKNRVQAKVNDRAASHLQNKENEEMASIGGGLGMHTIRPMNPDTPHKQPPPRTPPPSPISKVNRQLPDYPDTLNSTSGAGGCTLNIPRAMIKSGAPDCLAVLPESQPLLLQNLQLRPPIRKPNMQEVRV